jgi:hypothetical protein
MPITKASSNAVAPAAKGDLVVGNATNDSGVLAVGSTDQVLTVDSSTATGLKWATASAGGMTLLSTTTLSGASTTISSISGAYSNLYVVISGITSSANNYPYIKANNSATIFSGAITDNSSAVTPIFRGAVNLAVGNYDNYGAANAGNISAITIYNYASSTEYKSIFTAGGYLNGAGNARNYSHQGFLETNTAISSLVIATSTGTHSTGTVRIYGVK